jgi:hypothetical protein
MFSDRQIRLFRAAVQMGILPRGPAVDRHGFSVDGPPLGAYDSADYFAVATDPFIRPLVKSLRDRGVKGMNRQCELGMHGDGVYVWRDGQRYRAVLEPDMALDGKSRRRMSRDEIQDWLKSRLSEDDFEEYMRHLDAKAQDDYEPDAEDDLTISTPEDDPPEAEDSAEKFRRSLALGMDAELGRRTRQAEDYARKFPDAMRVRIAEDRKPVGGPSDPGVTQIHEPGAANGDRWSANPRDWGRR